MAFKKAMAGCVQKKGQVSIEIVLSFLVVFVLLVASAWLFVWFTDNLTKRQEYFAQTRTIHGDIISRVEGPVPSGVRPYAGYVDPDDVDTFEDFELEDLRLVD